MQQVVFKQKAVQVNEVTYLLAVTILSLLGMSVAIYSREDYPIIEKVNSIQF